MSMDSLPDAKAVTVQQYDTVFFNAWRDLEDKYKEVIDPLTTRVVWDFKDSADRSYQLRDGTSIPLDAAEGWNTAHVFQSVNAVMVTCTLYTRDGRMFGRQYPVKVAKRTRPTVSGETFVLLERAAASGNTVIDCGGKTIDWLRPIHASPGTYIKNLNVKFNDATTGFIGNEFTLRNVSFDMPSRAGDDDIKGMPTCVIPYGRNTLLEITLKNVQLGINGNTRPSFVLAQQIVLPDDTGVRDKFAWIEGSDWTFRGIDGRNATRNQFLRVGGADHVTIFGSLIGNIDRRKGGTPIEPQGDNLPAEGTSQWDMSRGGWVFHVGKFHAIIRTHCINNGGTGPLTGAAAPANWREQWCEIAQILDSFIEILDHNQHVQIGNGTRGAYIDGNTIVCPTMQPVFVEGVDASLPGRYSDRIIITSNNKLLTRKGDPLVHVGKGVKDVENAFDGKKME
jgi:hypothetical protein